MTIAKSHPFRLQESDIFSRSKLVRMYIPILLEQLLLAMLALADTLLASYLSDEATAGVSYVLTVNNWVNAFFSGLAAGSSVLTSQYIGGKRTAHAAASIRMALLANGVISFAFCGLLMINRAGFLQLVLGKMDPVTLGYSVDYFTYMIPAYFLRAMVFVCTATLRSQGNTKQSMILNVGMTLLSLAFKLLYSYGFNMGVRGFSLATTTASAVTVIAAVLLLEFGKGNIRVFTHLHGAKFVNLPMAIRSIGIGLPVAVDSSMFQTGVLMLSRMLVTYGVVHSAAQGISNQLTPILYHFGNCWGLVGLVAVGRCIGADDKEQAKRYYRLMMLYGIVIQFFNSIAGFLLADKLVLLFGGSPEVHALAAKLLRIFCIFAFPFYPMSFAQPQMLRGAGDTKFTMWVSIGAMFLVRVGLGYVLGTIFKLGAVGLYLAMCVNWIIRALCFAFRYRSGKWLNKKVY